LLLALTLAAFVLTAWILVRVPSPFGILFSGPRDVVSAQLQALDRGELRIAYGMFSDRYRQQVPYNEWNALIMSHWRMFHTKVLGAGKPSQSGSRVTLEVHLRGADDKLYRARFTLIRTTGRWWVDDLHWSDDPEEVRTQRI
jgi:ketosteroid isomerase-like protein